MDGAEQVMIVFGGIGILVVAIVVTVVGLLAWQIGKALKK